MHAKILLYSAFLFAMLSLIVGCATPQSTFIPATATIPAQTVVTNYVPNDVGTQIAAGLQGAAPLVPPPYGEVVGGVGTLLAIILGAIARSKNQQLANTQAAADTLARTIVTNGATTVAQAHVNAANDGTSSIVAEHIANV